MKRKKLRSLVDERVKEGKELFSAHPKSSLVRALWNRSKSTQLTTLASSVSYYLLLAIFPFILLFTSIVSVSGLFSRVNGDFVRFLEEMFPQQVVDFLADFVRENMQISGIPVLSVSSIMALWAASKGMGVLLRGLRRIYDGQQGSFSMIWRIVGLFFTLALCFAIILSLALLTFGDLLMQQIESWTESQIFTESWMTGIRFASAFVVLFLFFGVLYRVAGIKKTTFKQCLPGAASAAVAWILVSFLFSWYVANAGRFSLFYGSVAGIVILLLWIYFCSFSLLAGGLLNALLLEKKSGKLLESLHAVSEKGSP